MSLVRARRYMMEASLYLPLSKYLFPLSTYFLETTRGSLLQATSRIRQSAVTNKRRREIDIVFTQDTNSRVPRFPRAPVHRLFGSVNRPTDEPSASAVRTEEPKNRRTARASVAKRGAYPSSVRHSGGLFPGCVGRRRMRSTFLVH